MTEHKPWLDSYQTGVPDEVDVHAYSSLKEMLDEALVKYRGRAAFRYMGKVYRYETIDRAARDLAAHWQKLGLKPGDRVAIMMPNVPQYPVAVVAAIRAGLVVVNVNPLYTPRELAHQLKDSGALALVILEQFAHTFEAVAQEVPVQHVLLTAAGDMLGFPKGVLVNYVIRQIRKQVPAYHLPTAQRWNAAMASGRSQTLQPVSTGPDDMAVLQYTGGTTGVSKGAVLLHRNLVANVLQSEAWYRPALRRVPAGEQVTTVCALPLYHIFGFNINMMLGFYIGGCNVLIPNPRDLPSLFQAIKGLRIHSFPAVNTLFSAMLRHPEFDSVDWSHLRIAVGGGMAVQSQTAKDWMERTNSTIIEGYGLSETSPTVCCNPVDSVGHSGTIGLPLPSTEVRIVADDGKPVQAGQSGELAVRGPQVMAGYWQRPDETAKVMTADGFFLTGDIAIMEGDGSFRIVDRKKDMILVSGFNVYPNEIEDVLTQLPKVSECAAIGVADPKTGEAVKVVVVRRDPSLTEAEVKQWCEARLTGYKRPKWVEFRNDLPKSPVGKVLRRELRQSAH